MALSYSLNPSLTLTLTLCFIATTTLITTPTMARPLSSSSATTLLVRLKLDGDGGDGGDGGEGSSSSPCWDSLFALQSCSGEVILFFLNGETYLGPSCCQAIRTIQHHCWPTMLGSLGFTSEEGDILEGYCDAAAGSTPIPPPPPPPPAVAVGPTTDISHQFFMP